MRRRPIGVGQDRSATGGVRRSGAGLLVLAGRTGRIELGWGSIRDAIRGSQPRRGPLPRALGELA